MRTRIAERRRRIAKLTRAMDRLENQQMILNPATRKLEPMEEQKISIRSAMGEIETCIDTRDWEGV